MPSKPPRRRLHWLGFPVLAAMACALLATTLLFPIWVLGAAVLLALGTWAASKNGRLQLAKLAAHRPPEGGICTFARSFDLHHVDPWVVRATYEELHGYFSRLGVDIAIKADDRMIRDLEIDPDDLDMDIIKDIAGRAGRSLKNYKSNPYYTDTETVRGLVMFLNAQPRVA